MANLRNLFVLWREESREENHICAHEPQTTERKKNEINWPTHRANLKQKKLFSTADTKSDQANDLYGEKKRAKHEIGTKNPEEESLCHNKNQHSGFLCLHSDVH